MCFLMIFLNNLHSGRPDDESFAEFVKDRTRSGASAGDVGVVLTPSPPAKNESPAPVVAASTIEVQPVATASAFPAPISPVVAPSIAAVPPSASPSTVEVPLSKESTQADPVAGGGGGDFTDFLDKVVAETKKNIAETVVSASPKQSFVEGKAAVSLGYDDVITSQDSQPAFNLCQKSRKTRTR